MIPMRQTVMVRKPAGLDAWGEALPGQERAYRCRIDSTTEVVVNRDGREVISKATILITGVADVGYDDKLEWSDELGLHTERPVNVTVLRDFGGKPLFTKVVV